MNARDIAIYFLSKEPELFTNTIIEREGHPMYEGNLRLNKYLHIAQNVYIAKNGMLLFDDPLVAYDNGGVVLDVQQNYIPIKNHLEKGAAIPPEIESFLDQIANSLRHATVDELIDISHQDKEWDARNRSNNQRMDSISRAAEYREQYKNILTMMEMGLC